MILFFEKYYPHFLIIETVLVWGSFRSYTIYSCTLSLLYTIFNFYKLLCIVSCNN